MASEKGHLVATETPLATPAPSQLQVAAASSAPEAPPTATSADAAFALAAEISRAKSLKRSREETPPSPDSVESSSPGDLSPSKIARLVGFARSPPPSLNGTADHDEERRRRDEEHHAESVAASENLTHSPLADLMSGAPSGLARPPDAPSAPSMSSLDAAADAAARALSAVTIPAPSAVPNELKDVNQPSAPSASSLANPSGDVVNSPVPMDVDSREDQRLYAPQPDAQMEPQDKPPSSLSYPGVLPHGAPMSAPAPPSRGMSMPIPNAQGADVTPRSPGSSKKHKCPYCSTEFTRHHNLKSHLLTHSQEKPYVCSTCQMRFRRLHDLKRHSKLHTGEKPHICPKCDRKFARGDALARHSKGAGGCAGRRPSMGNFEDGDYDGVNPTGADESGLSNVMYEGAAEGELAAAEEERRRLSLPAIKAQHVPGQTAPEGYAAHSSTYPPAGPRPGGLYPPNVDRGSAGPPASPSVPNNHTPHTSISTMPLSAAGTTMYSQTGMTESPKPLSPGAAPPTALSHDALARQRPPAPQQPHFRPAEQAASGLSLPSHGNTSAPTSPATQQTAARGRSRASGGPPGPNRSGVVDGNNLFAAGEQGVWSYVQHMEDKFKHLQSMVEATSQTNAELTAKLNTHEQHISVLNQNTTELAAKVNAYEQHISSLNQTLTNLTAKCTNHEQHISVLTAEVTTLRQQQQHQQHQQQHPLHQHQQEHHLQENQQANHQVHQLQHQQEHQPEHPSEHQPVHPPEPQPQPDHQPGHQPGHQPEHQQEHQQHQPEHQQQHVPTETQEPPPAAQQ
ncbi:hypothetical protein SMACR_04325 [Sordaria macrospora]|uniref:C2H2-type domain-containing protein n=1 Tax=Sordaria macrospora TaxID=5147 RepID=A0A8S9A0J3_SORMA|nr:hypothetical protein SMACR_04325 [Sordaria macrospora]WPJ57934.1 hypothetical protein SMAC4_04325 [Sordaria macrospora]